MMQPDRYTDDVVEGEVHEFLARLLRSSEAIGVTNEGLASRTCLRVLYDRRNPAWCCPFRISADESPTVEE